MEKDPKVEDQLREFLAWEEGRRLRGETLESLHRKVDRLVEQYDFLHRAIFDIAKDRLEDRARTARHGNRIEAVERQVMLISTAPPMTDVPDWMPDPREKTGQHNLRDIQRAQKELEDKWAEDQKRKVESSIFWSRQRWIWAVAFLSTLLLAAICGCAALAIKQVSSSNNAPTHKEFAPYPPSSK